MIVIKLQGGLGNQLFQYTFGRTIADQLHQELYLDITTLQDATPRPHFTYRKYELHAFPVRAKIADQQILKSVIAYPKNKLDVYKLQLFKFAGRIRHLHENMFGFDAGLLSKIHNNTFLTGFWQSEKYFSNDEPAIRADLALPEPQDEQNIMCTRLIQNSNAVSVHIRRGDYVGNATHPVCSLSYYKKALRKMNAELTDPVFFIFSDDTEWVTDNLVIANVTHIIKHNVNNSAADLYLMSKCKHHIIANSSFSWWGAWLNPSGGKKVIAPKKWFNNQKVNTTDLIPQTWTLL